MPVSIFRTTALAVSAVLLSTAAWAEDPAAMQSFRNVTSEVLLDPSPTDWLMWRRTYNSWGHSPLDQINTDNIGRLQLAWATSRSPAIRKRRRSSITASCI